MSFSFLDILVERIVDGDSRRLSTESQLTLEWVRLLFNEIRVDYCPVKYKVGLVRCLANRALRICSHVKLSDELEILKELFVRIA